MNTDLSKQVNTCVSKQVNVNLENKGWQFLSKIAFNEQAIAKRTWKAIAWAKWTARVVLPEPPLRDERQIIIFLSAASEQVNKWTLIQVSKWVSEYLFEWTSEY